MKRSSKYRFLALALAAFLASGCGRAQKAEEKPTSTQTPAAVNSAADNVAKPGETGKEATTSEGVPTPAQPEKGTEATAAAKAPGAADLQKEREAALRKEREAALRKER